MNPDEEQCPVCGQAVNPGACEVCSHYFGTVWDWEMIWADRFEHFETSWDGLSRACQAFHKMHKGMPDPATRMRYERAIELVQGLDPVSTSPTAALQGLLPFRHGPTIETDGMLSGSGYSVYLKEPSDFERVLADVEAARIRVSELSSRDSG